MNIMEINFLNLKNYNTGAQFCRASNGKGGVVMYIHNSLKFTITDLCKYSKEKGIEICGVKLNVHSSIVCIITVYRSQVGNFIYFLQTLDKVLQSLYTPVSRIIICGDININYLTENDQKRRLDNMLLMHNLTGIVNFPTRINGTLATAIDNIFLDISLFEDHSVCPFINDLSDHDGQIVKIKF
jgi:exonuclease III